MALDAATAKFLLRSPPPSVCIRKREKHFLFKIEKQLVEIENEVVREVARGDKHNLRKPADRKSTNKRLTDFVNKPRRTNPPIVEHESPTDVWLV